jgi:DNA modification methylase
VSFALLTGDARDVLATLPERSVQCVVTSPPYFGLRDYGTGEAQIGLERTPLAYTMRLVDVFREVRRVLRDDGIVWLNLGDSYAGSGPSGASYQSATTQARAGKDTDGAFRLSKTLGRRGLTYSDKKPVPPAGLKHKDLIGIPWRVAFALQSDGWYLRQDIIWHKPNPMPESVIDRCTKAHEYVFLLSKSARYYYDAEAISEPLAESSIGRLAQDIDSQRGSDRAHAGGKTNGRMKAAMPRFGGAKYGDSDDPHHATKSGDEWIPNGRRNRRSVWTVPTQPYREAHFATYPPELIRPCIQAGTRPGDTVLDPFSGSGTTGLVALQHARRYIGIDLNPEYHALARKRLDPLAAQPTMFLPPERTGA